MELTIILERSNKHFSRFIELLKKESEIRVKDVRKLVAHSSYYSLIMRKLYSLNKLLREFNPELFLAEPYFDVSSKTVFTALKKCSCIEIESRQEYFVIRCKK